MAIENGTARGWRAIRTLQLQDGRLVTDTEYFEEAFGGQFTGLVLLPMFFVFDVTEEGGPYEIGHATCSMSGLPPGQLLRYEPSPLTQPSSVSVTVCNVSGSSIPTGISMHAQASPVTIGTPPCGPLPYVYFNPLPPVSSGAWTSNTYGYRGARV